MPKQSSASSPWTASNISENVHKIHFDGVNANWEQWVMLSSDRHTDNAHCDRKLEKRHLDMALERNAPIVDAGDMLCAMQGPMDKRASKSALREEDSRDDYLNALVENTAAWYAPYAHLFAVIGRGNHDTAVVKRYGFDLISALVREMNYGLSEKRSEHRVQAGGYGGWVRFSFDVRGRTQSLNLKYFHGAGGGGVVTRGVIETSRQSVYLPDADIVLNGHIHDSYIVPISRERFTANGNIKQDIITFVRTPTYKNEYRQGASGWHIETGKPPKPTGCCWARFFLKDDVIAYDMHLDIQ